VARVGFLVFSCEECFLAELILLPVAILFNLENKQQHYMWYISKQQQFNNSILNHYEEK
jgi:hypothetical protein